MTHEDVIRMAREAGLTFVPKEDSPAVRLAALAYQAGVKQSVDVAESFFVEDYIVEHIKKGEEAA